MHLTDKKRTCFVCKQVSSQDGFVLILTMVMLAVLSLLEVMVLNTTDTELSITSNSRMNSDAFVAAELVTEFAKQKVIKNPDFGSNDNLVNDSDLDDLLDLHPGIELEATGNEINFYTGLAPSKMSTQTSTDAYLRNIYRTTNVTGSGAGGEAAYYRVSVEAKARGRSTARVETLFVNRGGQVF